MVLASGPARQAPSQKLNAALDFALASLRAGDLAGAEFRLRDILIADLPAFARCITEKMLTYSLGRGLERYERKTVEGITGKLAANNYPFQMLVHEIVQSLPFQMRRGEASKTQPAAKPTKEVAQR